MVIVDDVILDRPVGGHVFVNYGAGRNDV
jgi:hypothetical protein